MSEATQIDPIFRRVEVPGMSGMQVLVLNNSTSNFQFSPDGSISPWWMIDIQINSGKSVLSSSLEGKHTKASVAPFKQFGHLYGFQIDARRESDTVVDRFLTSARICLYDCIVVLQNGGHITDIENAQKNHKLVHQVTLICLVPTGDTNTSPSSNPDRLVQQKIVFKEVYFSSISWALDYAFVSFRAKNKEYTFTQYSQSGKNEGQYISSYDLELMAVPEKQKNNVAKKL